VLGILCLISEVLRLVEVSLWCLDAGCQMALHREEEFVEECVTAL
jgi:hypothetical protein